MSPEHLMVLEQDEDGTYPQCTCGWIGTSVYDTPDEAKAAHEHHVLGSLYW